MKVDYARKCGYLCDRIMYTCLISNMRRSNDIVVSDYSLHHCERVVAQVSILCCVITVFVVL